MARDVRRPRLRRARQRVRIARADGPDRSRHPARRSPCGRGLALGLHERPGTSARRYRRDVARRGRAVPDGALRLADRLLGTRRRRLGTLRRLRRPDLERGLARGTPGRRRSCVSPRSPVIAKPPIPLPERWTLGDLERMRLILRGGSVIDWRRLHFQTHEEVDRYLRLCLFEPDDPFDRDRLQRILDEAVDYLRTTFRYVVTEEVAQPKQVQDLLLFASGVGHPQLRRVAWLVLKVMPVLPHG